MHLIQERKRLIPLLRKRQVYQHTAVRLTLQLVKCNLHLGVRLLEGVHQFIVKRDIALVHLVVKEHKNINQRDTVIGKAVYYLCIVLIIDRIRHIQQLRNLIVQLQKLRKIPCRQLVGQHVAVHRLRVGKPLRVVNLRPCIQLL